MARAWNGLVFSGTGVDGVIAHPDGRPNGGRRGAGPRAMPGTRRSRRGSLLIGRGTDEVLRGFPDWPGGSMVQRTSAVMR